MKIISILWSIMLIFIAFNLHADIFTRGQAIKKVTKIEEQPVNKKNQGTRLEKETASPNATEEKVLVSFEYWDLDGNRHVGSYNPVDVDDVKLGVTFGPSGQLSGTFVGTLVTNTIFTGANFYILRTGQIMSVFAGDDGDLKKGFNGGYINPDQSWNGNTRFETNSDGMNTTVLDKATGLMWTRDANIYGLINCPNAIVNYPVVCTVGGYSDWRCPNKNELQTIIDIEHSNPALPSGHPFWNVQSGAYWTGSNKALTPTDYFAVNFFYGEVYFVTTSSVNYVWFCRNP